MIFWPLFALILGVCVGSFLNVLIWRTLHGMSPYKGRSVCDKCGRQLAWYENIPVISFVVLGGRCRTCKKKIDWSYPLVEVTTGLLFLWWATLGFAFFRLSHEPMKFLQPGFWLVVGVVLIIIFFADLLYGIIPDSSLIVLGFSTLVYRLVLMNMDFYQVDDFWKAILSGGVAFLFFLGLFLATKMKGIGFGDVKFALVMGFLLGFPKSLVGFFLSFLIGGVWASLLLMTGKKKFGQKVPFGPFMVMGLVLALIWGDEIWIWYVGMLGI